MRYNAAIHQKSNILQIRLKSIGERLIKLFIIYLMRRQVKKFIFILDPSSKSDDHTVLLTLFFLFHDTNIVKNRRYRNKKGNDRLDISFCI